MQMTRSALIEALKAALGEAAERFTAPGDADFSRHLDRAAEDLVRVRPRVRTAELALEADTDLYAAPVDLISFLYPLWGRAAQRQTPVYDQSHPGRLPWPSLVDGAEGAMLLLSPAPTQRQIDLLGSAYRYAYSARHVIAESAAETSVRQADQGLVLLRAMAEAMRELAVRNVVKPIQLHRGIGSVPASGTPQALHEALMQAFHREGAA
jgi:hypothetical protein